MLSGRQGYASAFGERFGNADKVEQMCAELVTHGYNYMGKDLLTSGVWCGVVCVVWCGVDIVWCVWCVACGVVWK